MYLYEIKAASFAKKIEERFSADIDRDLEKTAGDIAQSSALRGGDETAMQGQDGMSPGEFGNAPDPMAGQSPLQQQDNPELAADDPMGAEPTDDEQDEMLMQKVDSILVNAAKGHPYSRKYKHPDNSKIHPYKILGMQMDELQQLRTMARNKANLDTFNGELGAYDNEDITFFQDLVSFVDKVIATKKSQTKEYDDKKQGKTAKAEKRKDSKTKPGKVKKQPVKRK